MKRKIYIYLTILIMVIALLAFIYTATYVAVYGYNGDGTNEGRIILGSWIIFLWCGLSLPSIINPDEDATSSLLEWLWPFG